LADDIGKD